MTGLSPSPAKESKVGKDETEYNDPDHDPSHRETSGPSTRLPQASPSRKQYQDDHHQQDRHHSQQNTEEDLRENDSLCRICMDALTDCILLECGHMVTCTTCGKQLSECPICRQYIVRVVRVFKSWSQLSITIIMFILPLPLILVIIMRRRRKVFMR